MVIDHLVTVQAYTADLHDFQNWIVVDAAIADVSSATLKKYLEDMVGRRALAVSTVRRRFACLRAFFRRVAKQCEVPDPFTTWLPVLPRRKRLPRALSRVEASYLISARAPNLAPVRGDKAAFRIIVRLMVVTGMRVSELCKLSLPDIAPDGSVVRIHGKGAHDRVAYITDASLRGELRQILQSRYRSEFSNGAVFVNRNGVEMKPQSVRSKLRGLAKEVGLERRVTPHMLRHTAATLLIEFGRRYSVRATSSWPLKYRDD